MLDGLLSIELLSLLFFLTLLFLIMVGVPIAFTLGGTAVVFGLLFWGPASLQMFTSNTFGTMQNIVLAAIPLFLFMGCVLQYLGVGEDMYKAAYHTLGRMAGGLAIGTVGICAVFAAMIGSSAPATVSMGMTALPSMLKRGYSPKIAIGCIGGAGALGILIPPSIPMILYALITGTSVGKMFLGGIIPGLLLIVMFSGYIAIRCAINPALGPPISRETLRKEIAQAKSEGYSSLGVYMPIILIVCMFAAMYGGIATPTEAAAVGALGSIIIGIVNRRLKRSLMGTAGMDTIGLTAMIMWVVLGGIWLSSVYQGIGAAQLVTNVFAELNLGPWGTLIAIQLTWFVLGCLLDPAAILFMTMPLFYPVVVAMGFDPVWFGVLFIINMEMSYLTPPFGLNLFYLKAVAPPDISMGKIIESCLPFLLIQATALILCMIFPQIITWLPNLMVY